jgi:hypothetical protein
MDVVGETLNIERGIVTGCHDNTYSVRALRVVPGEHSWSGKHGLPDP